MKTFVSIACYNDLDVIETCKNINAMSRHDVRIVVILQTDKPGRFVQLASLPNVEMVTHPESWAEGCGKPRAEAFELYRGEDFVFQTDSHMRFIKHWDALLMSEHKRTNDPKAILTTLPAHFDPGKVLPPCGWTYLGIKGFYNHLPQIVGYGLDPQLRRRPLKTAMCAGGVMFAPGAICTEVKPDPYFYFHGEELAYALRLWTHGYNFYNPRFGYCWHRYRKGPSEAPIDGRSMPLHERSLARAHVLSGVKRAEDVPNEYLIDLDRYGLGPVRTVKDWEAEFQISLLEQTFPPVSVHLGLT